MDFIKEFGQIGKRDSAIAGGKGASLGEMTQAGIPVPPGFVILSNAFEKFLVKKEMPKDVAEEIKKSFRKLGAKQVAVRSSATAEDSKDAAWAGQLESYLNTTEENLLENVQKCWKSLSLPRAVFYRSEKGLSKTKISVAVVVQKMIASEVSGVAFSVHPVTGDQNQIIIEAVFGLGESLVQGLVTPDSYVVAKDTWSILDKKIHTQDTSDNQKLSDKEILNLAKLVAKIESHYGFPVDVEWAFKKGEFYIVQSRPITTLLKNQILETSATHSNKNYKFFYESQGYSFLLEDLIATSYASWPVIIIGYENVVRDYLPEKALSLLKKKGELFTEKEIHESLHTIQEKVFCLQKIHVDATDFSIRSFSESFSVVEEILRAYSLFDISYSEGIFEKNEDDPRAKLIESSKNVIRDDLDFVFFKEDGFLNTLLKRIAESYEVDADDIHWYRKNELFNLIENKISLEKQIVDERKEVYIFDRDDMGDITFTQGTEALKIVKVFENNLHTDGASLKGVVANGTGVKITGEVCIIHRDYSNYQKLVDDMATMKEGSILVTTTTDPEFIPALKKAKAVITDIGGLLSHAAISARELGIPCIVGTEQATKILKNGDIVEVDTEKGTVRKINT